MDNYGQLRQNWLSVRPQLLGILTSETLRTQGSIGCFGITEDPRIHAAEPQDPVPLPHLGTTRTDSRRVLPTFGCTLVGGCKRSGTPRDEGPTANTLG